MEWIQDHWGYVVLAAPAVGYMLTAIASRTPNKSDDFWVQLVLTALNKVAWNVGTSKNKD